MRLADAPPPAGAQRPQGLRGRGPAREFYARRRRALRHPGRGQSSGEGAGAGARRQAVQSRTPALADHPGGPRLPGGCPRCLRIDTSNNFNVQRRLDATVTFGVLATLDAMPLSLDDALNIAAWLALKADPGG